MDNENREATTETKSIIDPKYAAAYKDKPKDWLSTFVDENATDEATKEKKTKVEETDENGDVVNDKDGNPVMVDGPVETVKTGKRSVNLDKLFALAKANHIDTAKYEEQADRPNAPGRLRMTIGNMLRARAKARHGLFDVEGEWHEASEEFLDGAERTQERDGTKIAKAKPAEAEASEEAAEE